MLLLSHRFWPEAPKRRIFSFLKRKQKWPEKEPQRMGEGTASAWAAILAGSTGGWGGGDN